MVIKHKIDERYLVAYPVETQIEVGEGGVGFEGGCYRTRAVDVDEIAEQI